MEARNVIDAAIAIDNHIIGRPDAHSDSVYRLSEKLYDISRPANDYIGLIGYIGILIEPVEKYFSESLKDNPHVSYLSEKLEQISNDLSEVASLPKDQQRKLSEFCLDLSRKGFDRERWQMRRLVA